MHRGNVAAAAARSAARVAETRGGAATRGHVARGDAPRAEPSLVAAATSGNRYYREYASRMYAALPYAITFGIAEFPYLVLYSVLHVGLLWAMVDFFPANDGFLWSPPRRQSLAPPGSAVLTNYPRPRRGVAATRLHGLSASPQRRRRDPPPRTIRVPAAASPRPASADYPRPRRVAATRLR